MSGKRSNPYQDHGGGQKKRKFRNKQTTVAMILRDASAEELELFNQRKVMQKTLRQDLLPEYHEDLSVQKAIAEARMFDEISETCWKQYKTVSELESDPPNFAKTIMNLDIKIIPNERNYYYVPESDQVKRTRNCQVRRQYRNLNLKRYQLLQDGDTIKAFNLYPVGFKMFKEDYFSKNFSSSDQRLNPRWFQLSTNDRKRCATFIAVAQKEIISLEIFNPLSSLRGTPNNPVTTPQDRRLLEKLKGKICVRDSKAKTQNNAPVKLVLNKTLKKNPSTQAHSYIPITEKALRFVAKKLNVTIDVLLDTAAVFTECPELSEQEENIIMEARMNRPGWSRQFEAENSPNAGMETQANSPNGGMETQANSPDVQPTYLDIPASSSNVVARSSSISESQEQIIQVAETVEEMSLATSGSEELNIDTTDTFSQSQDLSRSESVQDKHLQNDLDMSDSEEDETNQKERRPCQTVLKYGKSVRNFKSDKDELIIKSRGKKVEPSNPIFASNKVMFSTKFHDRNFSSDCKQNCAMKFLHRINRSKCSDSSKPYLDDLTYELLKKRVDDALRDGPFQCFFGGGNGGRLKPIPPKFQITLTGPTTGGGDQRHYTDLKPAMQKLWDLGFFSSIIDAQYCGLDVEGVPTRWEQIHKCKTKKSKPWSTVHFMSPNGVHFQLHCLFDGETFHGVNLNECKEILEHVLCDPEICKVGFGVSNDVLLINDSLTTGEIKNVLEAGKIIRFLNKGAQRTGKETASRFAKFDDIYPNEANVYPRFDNPNRPGFFDFTKDPRIWYESMNYYNRIDITLALWLLDKMTLFLCQFWGYDKPGFEKFNVAFPRLLAIFLLQDKSLYKGQSKIKEANRQASDPDDSPVNYVTDFKSNNPYRKPNLRAKYPFTVGIARKIIDKLEFRNIPYSPFLFKMSARDVPRLGHAFDNYPIEDWYKYSDKIAQIRYITLAHPHLCTKCGNDHEEEDCDAPKETLKCEYPLCKLNHATKICPMIINKCNDCELIGHLEEHHEDPEFDIFRAFNTQKVFSYLHVIASAMNHKEMIVVTEAKEFEPFVTHPKRGYLGDFDYEIKIKPKK